ncbi:MAG: class I SAM-dependent methyltransferase [Nitrospina sp.]|jgi:cyclopropane fatty-acyl-phospholipid synthase-like methyltransferase|nr:class I SAM-dependent methyltransferase [Nitrospina sp.]
MGLKFNRKKPRNYLNSLIYKLSKIPLVPDKIKFRFFSDLSWIFTRLAHEYGMVLTVKSLDADLHPMQKAQYDFLKDKISKEDVLLDFGCGSGNNTHRLAKICKSVTGVDHDSDKIRFANENFAAENVKFVCNDAVEFLKSSKQKYDVLVCANNLEHLDDPEGLIQDLKKYFSYAYIEVPDLDASYLNQAKTLLGIQLNYMDDDHVSEFVREDMYQLFAKQGLKIIESEYRFGAMKYWVEV